jgi:hypothetical protein
MPALLSRLRRTVSLPPVKYVMFSHSHTDPRTRARERACAARIIDVQIPHLSSLGAFPRKGQPCVPIVEQPDLVVSGTPHLRSPACGWSSYAGPQPRPSRWSRRQPEATCPSRPGWRAEGEVALQSWRRYAQGASAHPRMRSRRCSCRRGGRLARGGS